MNKKEFISELSLFHENIVSNIYDRIVLAKKTGRNIYTNEFYTPNIWKMIKSMENQIDLNVFSYGIFEDAERRMIAFSRNEIKEYPIDLMRITSNCKFSRLYHRDYLGALMSLGLKREKFGDVILKENGCCYMACSRDISKYIESSFTKVGNLSCKVDILDLNEVEIPNYDFEFITINVSSMRLDCIVSSLCNLSRNNGETLIKKGKVQVNYFECNKKDSVLDCNSTIAIRGYGKFKLSERVGITAKGRIKVLVKKFS
ncbi:RNA-binding protein [Clostridium sp. LBM24168]